jgi:uncharacterized protein YqfB (UPF0267 family)
MQQITFYQRFEADIILGKKTITIRDGSDKNYIPGTVVQALTYENASNFAQLEIVSVESIQFNQLNKTHAQQENMSLSELKRVIQQIYPETLQLYVLSFRLL